MDWGFSYVPSLRYIHKCHLQMVMGGLLVHTVWIFQMNKAATDDLIVATIALKYAQSNTVCFAHRGQVTVY